MKKFSLYGSIAQIDRNRTLWFNNFCWKMFYMMIQYPSWNKFHDLQFNYVVWYRVVSITGSVKVHEIYRNKWFNVAVWWYLQPWIQWDCLSWMLYIIHYYLLIITFFDGNSIITGEKCLLWWFNWHAWKSSST